MKDPIAEVDRLHRLHRLAKKKAAKAKRAALKYVALWRKERMKAGVLAMALMEMKFARKP